MATQTGSCHCGKVAIEVDGEPDAVVACNCSMCRRRGSLLWFVSRDAMRMLTDDAAAGTYTFNKHAIEYRFCLACGIGPYAEGTDPKGNQMAAINVRCLDGVDLDALPVHHYDGAAS